MKILVNISRIFVGILFVISGFIKLNDPMGFSFKLEEYFSTGVLNLPFLEPYALAIALVVVIFEVLVGVMLLLGFKSKFTVWSLLVMIVFFTFLTFYSAYFNKVTDCGCFGDAIHLTPWESFSKDVVLLVFIIFLFIGYKHIKPIPTEKFAFRGSFIALLACILYANYVLNHLPVIDFRAYKIGNNIEAGMTVPDDAPQAVFEYTWIFNVNGEEKAFVTNGSYPEVDGDFVEVKTEEVQKGYEPPIHDFTIEQDGDYTSEFLQEPKLLILISYDLSKASDEGLSAFNKLATKATSKGYKVIAMTSSSKQQAQPVVKKYGYNFEFYYTDQTTLKTIVRSNPGAVVLHKGTIVDKKHYNDFDSLKL